MACKALNGKGEPCGAPHWKDGYCYVHHEGSVAERAQKRRKGGRNKANAVSAQKAMVAYTIGNVRVLLSTALRDVMEGDMDAGVAAAVASQGQAVIVANEKGDLEKRITELERQAGIVTDGGR